MNKADIDEHNGIVRLIFRAKKYASKNCKWAPDCEDYGTIECFYCFLIDQFRKELEIPSETLRERIDQYFEEVREHG
jgi:hypothetical protein